MRSRTKILLISIVLTFLPVGLATAGLGEQIDEIIEPHIKDNVQFSIHIVKADTGRVVYEHNSRSPLIPASNMKLVTSASALHYLGPDYKYVTKVGLIGNTLVIIGSGDPILADGQTDKKYEREENWIIDSITAATKQQGVKNIQDIVVDTGVFDDQYVHQSWPSKDLNRTFACEISGLNYNLNCIKVNAVNVDGKVQVTIRPQTDFITFINEVEAITSGDSAIGTYRTNQTNRLRVFGTCKDRVGPFEVAIQKPAVLFGYLLYERLTDEGIETEGRLLEKVLNDYSNFKLIAEFTTPITDCLARCNKDSLGLAAEALLKTIAANNDPNGKNGSWEKGRELVAAYLQQLGVEPDQFNLDDGSGLSRENKLSAFAITRVLLDIYRSDNWEMFRDTLAVWCVDGTLAQYAERQEEQKYKEKILGKTGWINGVRSMSGVCLAEDGQYLYSIITNKANLMNRSVVNSIAKAIIDQ